MHSKVPKKAQLIGLSRGCPSPFTRLKRTGIFPVLFLVPVLRSRLLSLLAGFAGRLRRRFHTPFGARLHLVLRALLRCSAGLLGNSSAGPRLRWLSRRLLWGLLVVRWRDLLLSRRGAGGGAPGNAT
jgi:hypothetical protein